MTKRLALIPAAALAISVSLAGPAHAQDLLNCGDFTYQEDAQAVFDQDPTDPHGLDGPVGETSDGEPNVACESLPPRPDGIEPTEPPSPPATRTPSGAETSTPQVTETPSGGVPAGGGDGGTGGQVLVYAGLGTLIAAGGALALRRRVTE